MYYLHSLSRGDGIHFLQIVEAEEIGKIGDGTEYITRRVFYQGSSTDARSSMLEVGGTFDLVAKDRVWDDPSEAFRCAIQVLFFNGLDKGFREITSVPGRIR